MTDTLEQAYVKACIAGDLGRRTRLEVELELAGRTDDARLTAPDALIRAAVYYARRGIAVFPCEPRGKRPITKHGLKDATTDEAQIIEWWRATPNANIGAPTGITFDVVDVDGTEGVGALYGGDAVMPDEIGHSLTSRQAGHHIFIAPTGRGNGASILPSVDYRGLGGYVVLPPSVGGNGIRYVWTRPIEVTQ